MIYRCFTNDEIIVKYIASYDTKEFLFLLDKIVNLKELYCKENICIHLFSSREWINEKINNPNIFSDINLKKLPIYFNLQIWYVIGSEDFYFVLDLQKEDYSSLYAHIIFISRILFSTYLVLSAEVIILHGALFIKDNCASILIGPSGAGKSTAANRIEYPWRPISDDLMVAIKKPDNSYLVFGLPTWSKIIDRDEETGFGTIVNINDGYILKKIFFIEKANFDEIISISRSEGVNRIIKSSMEIYSQFCGNFSLEDKLIYKRILLKNSKKIVMNVNSALLKISLNGKFWELME